jgi:hypothetical protein
MNIAQKQTILTEIDTILGFDFDNMIITQLPENTELNTVMFGKYNVLDFKSLLYKVINQLKAELEKGFGLWLPNQETFYNDFGQVTLDAEIANLRTYISNIAYKDSASDILDRLIYYQIRQGFWDRSTIKVHNVSADKLAAAQEQLELVQKHLTANLEKFEELRKLFEAKQEEINSFFTSKKEDLAEVKVLLAEATSSNTKITELLATANNNDTAIAGVLKNVTDRLATVTDNITTYQTSFTTIETEAATLKQQLETTIAIALNDLDKAKQGIDFVQDKREEIVRLTGMAADGSLGSKFDQRQITLAGGLNFWKWGVPIVTALSILWVISVFSWLPTHTENVWINLLVNLLKTTPAFILMGFVFSQYAKERNLQEEYAFKSAVAMTLTAYSSMLEKRDDDGNKTRQEMLLKSIQQVYMQPRIHPEKPDRIYAMNGKHLKEAVQTLSEAVKNIKN